MSALLPIQTAQQLRKGIGEYLTTTFALSDKRAQVELEEFVHNEATSMFRGPYIRTRMPFAPADDGASGILDWQPQGFTPYGHQAAAFGRLSTTPIDGEPQTAEPTLVVTGTGSGKTEAFLLPILDHARRERAKGNVGVKALLLYPMNALATDQAERLARMISEDPALAAVTAGIYTGEQRQGGRTSVSAEGIITDRGTMQSDPPDILLTNYKMLDQLLLRQSDAEIWQASADSLQYVVLDEFHTYDGAQGTDVALLLRRLGLTLAEHRDAAHDSWFPLGNITPVATSATLGDEGDSSDIREFAETVFGRPFGRNSVVTESRLTPHQWATGDDSSAATKEPSTVRRAVEVLSDALADSDDPAGTIYATVCEHVLGLAEDTNGEFDVRVALAAARNNPLIESIYTETATAVSLDELTAAALPSVHATNPDDARSYIAAIIGALGFIRAQITSENSWEGRQIPSIEAHLWVRELSRIDRAVWRDEIRFRWHDGPASADDEDSTTSQFAPQYLPAIYCRHCGRSGWMTAYEPGTTRPVFAPSKIRQLSLSDRSAVRALISADQEVHSAVERNIALSATRSADTSTTALRWLDSSAESFSEADTVPLDDLDDKKKAPEGTVAVLMHSGQDAKKQAERQTCPACGTRESIRYIGSAVATLLSVAVSNIFGTTGLDSADKKALVFADSVQDASHRAGFVEARSHAFSLRTAITTMLGNETLSLTELAEGLRDRTSDPADRYHLLHPSLVGRKTFRPFWDEKFGGTKEFNKARKLVGERLAFDMCLEFGLRDSLGRTLALTGTAVPHVSDNGSDLGALAREAWNSTSVEGQLASENISDAELTHWARIVLERIRQRGGIQHPWLDEYVRSDGNSYHLFKQKAKARGVPGFPPGGAPGFPRIGGALPDSKYIQGTDPVAINRSWYARWTSRALGVTADSGQKLVKALLERLAEQQVISAVTTESGAVCYQIEMDHVDVSAEAEPGELHCDVCQNVTPASSLVRAQVAGAPCLTVDCAGRLVDQPIANNYYRRLYTSADSRAVVSREHTSMLDNDVRSELEKQFKSSSNEPGAPNVLVATPTLEMGIDIGDLSSVMLSSLPKTVANYVQRVGRAGRLTGNSLVVALLQGRGLTLPTVQDPLSMINGAVQPPATFLSAAEILRRQFLAFVVEQLMHEGIVPASNRARDVFRSHSGSLLAEMRAGLAESGTAWLEKFLGTIDGEISDHAATKLREWVEGANDAEHSIASTIALAGQRWRDDERELTYRLDHLDDIQDELRIKAESAVATDEDKNAYRSVTSAAASTRYRLKDMREDFWIRAMEHYGLLPSYQLLDDSVDLEASIRWQDPDTFEWDADKRTFTRGASSAIREFAPGNNFYVDRLRIRIDSIDLGHEGANVQQWRVCAACAHSETVVASDKPAVSCPACGDATYADMSQLLDVVPLRKVSADVRRDSATVDESHEQRRSITYQVATTMSFRGKDVASEWYVEGTGFGAKYLREAEIRWLNLGAGTGNAATIGGEKFAAPLFRLCEYCGHEDVGGVGTNTRADHRPWCKYSTDTEEHNRAVALGRTLRTESVVLRLPLNVSSFDSMTLPSLIAAIKLGFREVLGGNPDHLEVGQISIAQGGSVAPALLLHDNVPGGTGYLAEFAEPGKVRDLLEAAWNVVHTCSCKNEESRHDKDRYACPRCLLPHTPPGQYERTSREVAEGVLFRLLGGTEDDDGAPRFHEWTITDVPPPDDAESHLEVRFRQRFKDELLARGAKVTETPDGQYTKLLIKTPAENVSWQLKAQVDLPAGANSTTPDFVLERTDGGSRRFVIYVDGRRYHATTEHNRIADDAQKRAALRANGDIPWAITSADLDASQEKDTTKASWYERKAAVMAAKLTAIPPDHLESAATDAVSFLVGLVMNEPSKIGGETWDAIGNAVACCAAARAWQNKDLNDTKDLFWIDRTYARVEISGDTRSPRRLATSLHIDASDAAVGSGDTFAEDWRWWLRLSNLFSLRHDSSLSTIGTELSSMPAHDLFVSDTAVHTEKLGSPASSDVHEHNELSADWLAELDQLDENYEEDRELLGVLRRLGAAGLPVPSVGEEVKRVLTAAAWNDRKIAIFLSEPDDSVQPMLDDGWRVFDGTADDFADTIAAEFATETR